MKSKIILLATTLIAFSSSLSAQALVMAEAAALAQLDVANLNNRQQAGVQTALPIRPVVTQADMYLNTKILKSSILRKIHMY